MAACRCVSGTVVWLVQLCRCCKFATFLGSVLSGLWRLTTSLGISRISKKGRQNSVVCSRVAISPVSCYCTVDTQSHNSSQIHQRPTLRVSCPRCSSGWPLTTLLSPATSHKLSTRQMARTARTASAVVAAAAISFSRSVAARGSAAPRTSTSSSRASSCRLHVPTFLLQERD